MTPPAAWFSRVGAPLTPDERGAIAALLHEHPQLGNAAIGVVAHWHEAGEVVRADDREGGWWDREEDERQHLWQLAAQRIPEAELLARITAATEAFADAVSNCATAAAKRDGVADPGLVRAAAGAALMAAQQSALAAHAGADDGHFFVRKHALFTGGRWPLGYHSGRYIVF